MKKTPPTDAYVFDTSALLTLWNDEEGADGVEATNNLSVCDSWIIATAIATDAILVHKDPEFEQVKTIVKLKALPYKPSPKGKKRE